jgi:hypothetical protein
MAYAAEASLDTRSRATAAEGAQRGAAPLEFRWRVLDDPPPLKPTRFQQIFAFLYEYNKY